MSKHPSLAAALIAAQQQFTPVKKDNTANTGKFSYTYADLGSVLEAVTPALHANGLVVSQCMDLYDGQPCIKTVLMHADSDKELLSFTPIIWADKNDPQKFGGGITYSRRYAIMAMLNLNAEDDDATHARRPNGVSDTTTIARNTPSMQRTTTERGDPFPKDSDQRPPVSRVPEAVNDEDLFEPDPNNAQSPSAAQFRRLFAMQKQLGLSTDDVHAELDNLYGITSRKQLDWRQYKEYTEKLDARIKKQAGR